MVRSMKRRQDKWDAGKNRSRWSVFKRYNFWMSLGRGLVYKNWFNRRRRINKRNRRARS